MKKIEQNKIEISDFEKSDLADIVNVAIRAFKPNYASYKKILGDKMFKGFYPDWQEKKKQEIIFLSNSESSKLFVAKLNKKIVGFASFILNKNKPFIAEISNNAVHPNYQRKGVGSALYNHIFNTLKKLGIKYIKVSTVGDEASKSARKAYEKAGFKKQIPKVDYYMQL